MVGAYRRASWSPARAMVRRASVVSDATLIGALRVHDVERSSIGDGGRFGSACACKLPCRAQRYVGLTAHFRLFALRSRTVRMIYVTVLALASAACSTDHASDADCVQASLDCRPIVSPPTFDALYANVLQPSCAANTGRCHGSANFTGGVDMRTADSTYAALAARVQPDAVGCSLLVKRVASTDTTFRMPPGPTPLSEPQQCAIRLWIANGAKR